MYPANDPEAAAEVMAVERAWVQAHLSLDLGELERVMADDYLAVDQDGALVDLVPCETLSHPVETTFSHSGQHTLDLGWFQRTEIHVHTQ